MNKSGLKCLRNGVAAVLLPVFAQNVVVPNVAQAQNLSQEQDYKHLTWQQIQAIKRNFAAELLVIDYDSLIDEKAKLPEDWVHPDRYKYLQKKYKSKTLIMSYECGSIEAASNILSSMVQQKYKDNKIVDYYLIIKHTPNKSVTYPNSDENLIKGLETHFDVLESTDNQLRRLMKMLFDSTLEYLNKQVAAGKKIELLQSHPFAKDALQSGCFIN